MKIKNDVENGVKNEVKNGVKTVKIQNLQKCLTIFKKKKIFEKSFISFFDVQWTLFTCMQQINV